MDNMLHVLQHAIGVDEYGEGAQYRNHFVAGGTDLLLCREAASQGLMAEHLATPISGGSPWFSVTRAGKEYVATNSPAKPKVSRSKQRYRRYLTYRDMFDSFLEFCRWDALPEHSWNCR